MHSYGLNSSSKNSFPPTKDTCVIKYWTILKVKSMCALGVGGDDFAGALHDL